MPIWERRDGAPQDDAPAGTHGEEADPAVTEVQEPTVAVAREPVVNEAPGPPPSETGQPAVPGAEQPAVPGAEQPAVPGAEQPAVPGAEQRAVPGAERPAVPGAEQPVAAELSPQRWSEILVAFVDDPRGSVQMAADAVDEAIDEFVNSVRARQRSLGSSWQGTETGTEELRTALRDYRKLWHQVRQLDLGGKTGA